MIAFLMKTFHLSMFPSPQGGSETQFSDDLDIVDEVFPSPQGGSETPNNETGMTLFVKVSIPSRRVGDTEFIPTLILHLLVSIPSRRVGDGRYGM